MKRPPEPPPIRWEGASPTTRRRVLYAWFVYVALVIGMMIFIVASGGLK